MSSLKTSWVQQCFLFFFSLFLTFFLLEIGLRDGGFLWLLNQERYNKTSPGEYRIMCLGESTTALGGYYAYPAQLERILNERRPDIKFNVIHKAIPGAFTSNLLFQLEDNIFRYKPDMAIIMAGINDAIYFRNVKMDLVRKIKDKYFKNFKTYRLLNLLRMHMMAKIDEYKNAQEAKKKSQDQISPQAKPAQDVVIPFEEEYYGYFDSQYII